MALLQKYSRGDLQHISIGLRELVGYFSDAGWWRLASYGLLVVPGLYAAYQTYRLWRGQTFDLVLVAKLLPAALLALPYNRAYDWVLAIPAYLVLWDLVGRRWTPAMIGNIVLALVAFPISTATYLISWAPLYAHLPISLNPLPLIGLILTLEWVTHQMRSKLGPNAFPESLTSRRASSIISGPVAQAT
ncbi:MAG TPA: hypothetical protein VKY74_04435 [Chloroflexia bacterium]|nr:hypothetical protein [Chloroflexia bacterium]